MKPVTPTDQARIERILTLLDGLREPYRSNAAAWLRRALRLDGRPLKSALRDHLGAKGEWERRQVLDALEALATRACEVFGTDGEVCSDVDVR